MKLHRQYLRLHARYGGDAEGSTTLEEIGRLLECTPRNATNIVREMSRSGWISWEASRGRGKRSVLRFLVQPEEIAAQAMMAAMNRKDMTQAIGELRDYRSASLQEHLQGWLLSYFGHHAEIRSDRRYDTFRLPIRQPLRTVDPLYMNLLAESFVASHVFDGLVRRTQRREEIAPGIAHAWDVDDGRTGWTFHLRKEVLFHHGKVLTADDVVYTFERLVRSTRRTLYGHIYKGISSVRAIDANTVRFTLEEPNELFLPFLCTSRAAIVPKDLNQLGSLRFGHAPLGTGPFKVAEMNEGICVLEAFSSHFQGRAHLDRVEIVHVPWEAVPSGGTDKPHGDGGSGGAAKSGNSGGAALTGGTMDGASGPGAETLSPFHVIHSPSSAERGWSHIHSDTTVRKFVTCNTKKTGPLSDPAERARLFASIGKSVGRSADAAGEPVALQLATITPYRADAEALAAKLGERGYACRVVCVPPEEFKGDVRLASDLILFSSLRDQDEQLRLYDLYLTIAEHVDAHTRIDIEIALRRVDKEADPTVRSFELGKVEQLLIKERQLYILSERPLPTAYLPSVRGVTFNSQGWVNLRTIWFPPKETSIDGG
ncbi:ABC transporter substrate-binding protein [Cohnella suwonensis]|uniref:ABC transporter substrate-binding protein n=1 Tax=Cohnella suwonensis TaxID=696072 RepID=A0ABW0LYY2_9BACL